MYTDAIDLLKTTVLLKLDGSLPLLTEKETVLALGGILSVGSEQATADQYSGTKYTQSVTYIHVYTCGHKHSHTHKHIMYTVYTCAHHKNTHTFTRCRR